MNNIKGMTIAVVGVSQLPDKYGHRIFRDLLAAGYRVEGVGLHANEVSGKKIHLSLKEIVPAPDMVVTVVRPEITEHIVEECKMLGIQRIWMQPGSESEAAVSKAKEYGLLVTANMCIMVAQGLW